MPARVTGLVCLSLVAFSGVGQVAIQTQDEKGNTGRTGTRQKTLNICEALQSAVALNGSEVVIRGYYRFGMEMAGLYGRNCPKKLTIDGKERLQAFYLKNQRGLDDAELVAAVRKLMAEKDTRSAILVTVTGTIDAISHVWTENIGPLQVQRQGRVFGHMGAYPAQINVGSVHDVALIDAPDFRSNFNPER